jgi:hypothetical protein
MNRGITNGEVAGIKKGHVMATHVGGEKRAVRCDPILRFHVGNMLMDSTVLLLSGLKTKSANVN